MAGTRVAMVSGANRGIGLAIAREMARRGCALSLGVRRPQALPAELRALGDPADASGVYGVDSSSSSLIDAAIRAAIDIVQKAQPLPPIPERMHTDRVEGELPVNFGMRRYTGGASKGSAEDPASPRQHGDFGNGGRRM